MKHISSCAAITIVLVSFALGQSVNQKGLGDSSSEQEVRQAIEKYRAALLQPDIPALRQIWADSYFFVNPQGTLLSKAQRLENLKSDTTRLESINDEEVTVHIYQSTAVATSRVTVKGEYSGQKTNDQFRTISVWVKGQTGWQLVANQLTALNQK
jgi:ketosteroid isomerase-like protein